MRLVLSLHKVFRKERYVGRNTMGVCLTNLSMLMGTIVLIITFTQSALYMIYFNYCCLICKNILSLLHMKVLHIFTCICDLYGCIPVINADRELNYNIHTLEIIYM